MHELSICESIISSLKKEYKNVNSKQKITSVYLTIGDMHQVIEENLRVAWEVVTRESPFAESTLEIKWMPVLLECNECKEKREKEGLMFLCTACGSRNVEIVQGKELYIDQMGVETNE